MQVKLTAQSMGTFNSHARIFISGWICPEVANDPDFPKPEEAVEEKVQVTNVFTLVKNEI